LKKLSSAQPVIISSKVTAKAISNNLFKTSNIKHSKQKTKPKITINDNFKAEFNKCDEKTTLMYVFLVEEVNLALKSVKNGKAAGSDGILPEFIKILGYRGRHWIAKLVITVSNKGTLLKLWREAKVVAILKPNKSGDVVNNFRPISLLSVVYKLFKRMHLK